MDGNERARRLARNSLKELKHCSRILTLIYQSKHSETDMEFSCVFSRKTVRSKILCNPSITCSQALQ